MSEKIPDRDNTHTLTAGEPLWQFPEMRHSGVDYADRRVAEEYDRQHAAFRDFEKDALLVIERLGLGSGDSVIDLGCGTGAFALTAARHCRRVHAVDISPAMLDICRDKARQQGLANIDTHQAGFLTYRHTDEPADAIVSVAALHHLPDFWKGAALTRLAGMLRPGGRLHLFDVVFSFPPADYVREMNNWVEGMRSDAGEAMAEETVVHIRDEYSTFDWIMDGLLERAGFRIDEKLSEFPRCLTYICTRLRL